MSNIEIIIILIVLVIPSLIIIYLFSDEYCDKQLEKIIKEGRKENE